MRDLIPSWDASKLATEGVLHDSANPPLLLNRSEVEDNLFAAMPGDDLEQHPLYDKPNKYMVLPYFELRTLLEEKRISKQDRPEAIRALNLKAAAAGQKRRALNKGPDPLPPEQTEARTYSDAHFVKDAVIEDSHGNVVYDPFKKLVTLPCGAMVMED